MPTLSDSLKESLEARTTAYSAQLSRDGPTSHRGRDYLASRLLADPWVVEPYRLGVVAEPLPGDEPYRGRLVIPALTLTGVRGLAFRCTQDHKCDGHPKYLYPFGQEQRLYNALAYFGTHDTIGIAEGQLNGLSATVHLGLPTFGCAGTQSWEKHGWYWQLALRDFSQIIVFADGDKPGKDFAAKVANDAGQGVRVVYCDDDEDVNSMVVAGKGDKLRRKAGL